MNLFLATLGSSGDVFPFIIIGEHMAKRGHKVFLCTNPYFKCLAESRGLEFISVGSAQEYIAGVHSRALWDSETALDTLCRYMLKQQDEMYQQLESMVDSSSVLLTSLWSFSAKTLGEQKGCCTLPVRVGPSTFLSCYNLPQHGKLALANKLPMTLRKGIVSLFEKQVLDKRFCAEVNTLRSRVGLAPVKRILSQWVHTSADGLICLFPEWFAHPQPDWPRNANLVGLPLFEAENAPVDEELGRFLERETVLFSPGWSLQFDEYFFNAIVAEVTRQRRQCLVVGVNPEDVPVRPGVLVKKEVDLAACLRHCVAAVHHGGIGTISHCFYQSVPQLIFPSAFDQFDNAYRVEQLGCGIQAKSRLPEKFSDALARVMTDENMRERCRRIQEKYGDKNHCLENVRHALEQAHQRHASCPGSVAYR
ncbi:glycosyltransferase [Lonsdalea quercina]|uniref:glycosyltransferase n=1 Tax=Lonsdalea quercina TaxID=71657 RepID=UPI0039765A1B